MEPIQTTYSLQIETPGEPELTEPHFDEETTLLSAKPVVPLAKLKAQLTSRRRIFLAGAVSLAILLGACAAILIFYLQQRQFRPLADSTSQLSGAQETTSPDDQTEVASQSALSGGSLTTPDAETVTTRTLGSMETGSTHKVNVSNKQKLRPMPVNAKSRTAVAIGMQPQVNNRDTHRLARREERPRREPRDRDRRRAVSSDDLFRIREIFEGTRRPN